LKQDADQKQASNLNNIEKIIKKNKIQIYPEENINKISPVLLFNDEKNLKIKFENKNELGFKIIKKIKNKETIIALNSNNEKNNKISNTLKIFNDLKKNNKNSQAIVSAIDIDSVVNKFGF
jgi:hypothetical protein